MGDRPSIYNSPQSENVVVSTDPEEFVDGAYEDWDLSFASIVDSINDGVLVVRFDGCIIYVNPRMGTMLGYDHEDVVGRHVFEFMDEEWAERTKKRLEERSGGKEDEYDLKVIHRDGQPVWLHVAARPVRDRLGRPRCSLVAAQDVTDRKQMEEKLLEARRAAEEASRAKGDFLARMSHEIRTPMNGVIGMLELLEHTELSEEQERYLGTAYDAARGLLGLIDDVLDLSKIEARRLELDDVEFSLGEEVSETLQTLAGQAAEKELELVYFVDEDIPDRLIGDPGRLRQILVNLVKNSIKFTDEGQISVLVTLEHREDRRATIHFSVTDTGRGIPDDEKERIFDAFHRVGAGRRSEEGTGLGLTIAAQLVDMMEGRLWLDSTRGRGTTFYFTARFDVAAEESEESGRKLSPLIEMPVMVVDKNPVSRRFLKTLLSSWKMNPTVVENFTAARKALEDGEERSPYNLLVVGLHRGDEGELQALDELRTDAEEASTIVLSPTGVVLSSRRLDRHGIDRQLFMPVRPSSLFDAICGVTGIEGVRTKDVEKRRPQAAMSSLRILLAEDNPVNQRVTVGLLEKRGHDVEVVDNGRDAVASLEEGAEFDLVLMDIQMPEMDGYEATGEIRRREEEKGGHIPIVALTAHAMRGDRERMLAAGMDDYLSKPVAADDLYETIESAIVGVDEDQ